LDIRLLPGRELRIDCAVSFGSFWGTLGWSAERAAEVVKEVMADAARIEGVVGRRRAAPMGG